MKQLKNRKTTRSYSWQKKRKRKGSLHINLHIKPLRARSPRKKINKKAITRAAILLMASLCAYFLIFSDYFSIKNIAISGNESVDKGRIEEVVKQELSIPNYKYLPGNNYFFVNKESLAKKITESFSEIETVKVSRKFPSGIEISIKEKHPALIWCRESCFFVNDDGVAFLPVDGNDKTGQQKERFIKIIEEAEIPEEQNGENPNIPDVEGATKSTDTKSTTDNNQPNNSQTNEKTAAQTNAQTAAAPAETAPEEALVGQGIIALNDQVSDKSFIKFTIDINNYMSYNNKLKIKYYKTKGTKTRELIGFTDKNTRIYFDATQDAKRQVDNLNYFLEKGAQKDQIDNIKYIYLKNNDRVFYK